MNALQPQYDWSSTPLRGFVISDGFSLKRALTDARQRKDIEGLLLLRADLEGTIAAPQIDATAQINAGRVGKTRFERFEARHSQNTGTRRTRLDIAQIDGGVLRARVDARDRTPFDLKVEAERFDIGFLATVSEMLNAGAAIEGMLNGTLAMDGDQTEGKLSASNLRVALPGAPPIERATLNIALADQQAKIDLRARSGPGRIQAEAIANTAPSATPTIKGRFVLDDVQVAGGGQIASVDLTGRILGQRQPSQFETEVVLTDGLIRLPDRNARNLHPITTRSDVVYQRSRWRGARPSSSRPPQPSALSFHVRTQKPIGVRGEPLDVIINTDIIARPQLRGMSVKGDARVEQGTVTLFGRRYTVDRTQVTLGGQVPPDPRIDILLSYEFNACTFFIGVGGPLSNPKLQLSAEPDIYDDKQLLGFLFGASPDEDNPDKTPQQQGVDAAAGVLLGQLQAQLKRNLPIDTLAVDLGDGTTSGQANVSLGKWLTDRLFVAYTYRHGAAQTENTSEGLLRYRFLHPWLVELVFGDRGNGAADLLWSKRW
ncbi:MAG: translocation/assembly module TamB domain-containing protein [Myxococcota bacterium]